MPPVRPVRMGQWSLPPLNLSFVGLHSAVEQARQPGVSCVHVAQELEIRDTLLTHWKRNARSPSAFAFGSTGTPRDEEMARHSKIAMTSELDNYPKWDLDAMERRQEGLGGIAEEIWQI